MSKTRLPISVAIVAKNEADRIPLVLASVALWVDQIIVVDSGSTDETPSICEAHGAEVVFHEWLGFAPQKHVAQEKCRNDWVLCIDADEALSAQLQDEVKALFADGEPDCDAYRVPLLPIYNWQKKHRTATVHRFPIKLYRRSKGTIRGDIDPLDDTVKMQANSSVGKLKGPLNHYSFRSLHDHIDKVNWNSENQAASLMKRGKRPGLLDLLFVPPFAFLKQFILRREFLNGVDGIVISYMFAFQRFIRIAKARERQLGVPFGPDAKIGETPSESPSETSGETMTSGAQPARGGDTLRSPIDESKPVEEGT